MIKTLIHGAAVLALMGFGGLAAAQSYGGAESKQECTEANWRDGYIDPSHPHASVARTMGLRDPMLGWRPCPQAGLAANVQSQVFVNPAATVFGRPAAIPRAPVVAVQPDRDGDGTPDSLDRDRDGDGVRNSRDRYPDDPRYR